MAQDMVYEEVPRLRRRVGDNMVAGANNATILLGRDRPGGVESGYGSSPGAGAIHMMVGRAGEDPSPGSDAATIYMSAKTDPDAVAGTLGLSPSSPDRITRSGIIGRADCVRITARADLKISVGRAYLIVDQGGRIVIEGDVSLGEGAAQRIIRGDAFAAVWANHVHPTSVGPSGPPQPLPDSVFSARNKVL